MVVIVVVVFVVLSLFVIVGVVVVIVGHRNLASKFDQNWVNNKSYIVVVVVIVAKLNSNFNPLKLKLQPT